MSVQFQLNKRRTLSAIFFSAADYIPLKEPWDILFTVERNSLTGKIQLKILDWKSSQETDSVKKREEP